ncbi:MAG: hypothetical protein LBF12_05095 [Christensenellaceae bacterium]|jgi:signal transduction histidine kinase|nr:hypothetical protein [Christensenellaceae bacterium]
MEFLKNLTKLLKTDLDFLTLGQTFGPAIYLCLAGIVAILIAYVISVFVSKGSNVAKLTKRISKVTNNIRGVDPIDENNINEFNKNFITLPESIKRGWSGFLSIQTKYPSDYILEKDIIEDPKENLTTSGFRSFFLGASLFIAILLGIVSLGVQIESYEWKFSLTNILFIVLQTLLVVVPLLFLTGLFSSSAGRIDNKQRKNLSDTIKSFLLALDNCLILFREERDEFSSENIEEIDAAIEKILAGRVDVGSEVLADKLDETPSSVLEFVPVKPENDNEIVEPVDAILLYDENALTSKVLDLTATDDEIDDTLVDEELNDYVEELIHDDEVDLESITDETTDEDSILEEPPVVEDEVSESVTQEITEETVSEVEEAEVVQDEVEDEPVYEEAAVEIVDEQPEPVPEVVEEPQAAQIVEEELVEPVEESVLDAIKLEDGEEDISSDLVVLVEAVDAAVSDPITTKGDLEELTLILDDARRSGIFERKVEQLIFDTCFEIVAEIYFKFDDKKPA